MVGAADQALIEAVTAKFQRGDLAGARADCDRFLHAVADPTRQAPLRFWLGAVEQRSGALPAAVEQFEIAIKTDRRNPLWLVQAGLAHFHLNTIERAEYLYREALRLQPRYPVAHFNLGVLLQRKRNWVGARRAFEAAIAQQPQFAEAHVNLANTLVELTEFDTAEAGYRRALEINPKLANAHHGLGLHYFRKHQHADATRCFEAAIDCDPAHHDAWLDLAECFFLDGNRTRAVACVDHVLAREPNHEIARFKRAQFSGENPSTVPPQLLERLYAGMANTFDEHLTERLGYRIPEMLVAELQPWFGDFTHRHARKPAVLDLGCGTGLFGLAARSFSATLTGVDLSAAMLDRARERGVYDDVVESDLQLFLQRDDRKFDLIAATDVLIYIGQLDPLFALIPAHLSQHGLFAFSTESPPDLTEEFQLEPTGRFAHHNKYIERLAESNGLAVMKRIDTVIRNERNVPLSGHIFILQKI
jgi:predicted TPR repeat methyltransferase